MVGDAADAGVGTEALGDPHALARTSLRPRERRVLRRALADLRSALGDDLHAVWLYGSRARGEPGHAESDVDLLVLTERGSADHARVHDALGAAAEAEGASPVFFSAVVADREWVAGRRAIQAFFLLEVDRDKVVLVGDP